MGVRVLRVLIPCFPGGCFPARPTTSWRHWCEHYDCRPTGVFTGRLPTPNARRTCSFACSKRLRAFLASTCAIAAAAADAGGEPASVEEVCKEICWGGGWLVGCWLLVGCVAFGRFPL